MVSTFRIRDFLSGSANLNPGYRAAQNVSAFATEENQIDAFAQKNQGCQRGYHRCI